MSDKQDSTVELLKTRLQKGRQDNNHLALVVEGGGMRGAITAGMMLVLEQLEAVSVFDSIFGVSSGAMNVLFFKSRQGPLGVSVYYDDLLKKEFLHWPRLLTGSSVINLDYLFEHVFVESKPLNWSLALKKEPSLKIVATCVDTLQSEAFSAPETKQELSRYLMAATTIPFLAGEPVSIERKQYLDASLTESIPYKSAIEHGATHVLILRSQPRNEEKTELNFLIKRLGAMYLEGYQPGLGRLFALSRHRCRGSVEEIKQLSEADKSPPYLKEVAVPDSQHMPSKFERDERKVIKGIESGANAMLHVLGMKRYISQRVFNFFDPAGKNLKELVL